jgi:3-deoxy-7-phosphoheptulonate synthase
MVIVMKADATDREIEEVAQFVNEHDARAHISQGEERTIIGVIGYKHQVRKEHLHVLPGVEKVIPISKPYKLVSREFKSDNTVIPLDGVRIGEEVVIMAGPCSVENEKQILETAEIVKQNGGHLLRGGAYKPRTNPYSFQGLGEGGLKLLQKARQETGILVVTEVLEAMYVPLVAEHTDIIQIGARNMQNYELLKAVVLLCERGIRTFVEYSRNTLDLNVVPAIKKISHLPVVVDPSHGTGRRDLVEPLSIAALSVGADGLMIEVHPRPEEALSDADQTLDPESFRRLMRRINSYITWQKRYMEEEQELLKSAS